MRFAKVAFPVSPIRYDRMDKDENIENHIYSMLAKASEMFEWKNLPDSIPVQHLERFLQVGGSCIIAEHNGTLYALQGSLGGECDAYYMPRFYTVVNPWISLDKVFEIGKDCVLCMNDNYGQGLLPMIAKYAAMITENEISIDLATINKRMITLLAACDNGTYDSAKKYLADIEAGKQGIIADEEFLESLKAIPLPAVQRNLEELFETQQFLISRFYNEIGLSSNYNMKRERLTKGEVESNTANLYPLVDNMLDNRRRFVDAVNTMFGTEIEVAFNSSWDIRLLAGEKIDVSTLDELQEEKETVGENETETAVENETAVETIAENETETAVETIAEDETETAKETVEEKEEKDDEDK